MLELAGKTYWSQFRNSPDFVVLFIPGEQFLVVEGTCTHLGCLPKARFAKALPELGADWPGGFFCPCHGSKFDMAGRVFEGSPAGQNLRIPVYSFPTDNTLVIGVDPATGAA